MLLPPVSHFSSSSKSSMLMDRAVVAAGTPVYVPRSKYQTETNRPQLRLEGRNPGRSRMVPGAATLRLQGRQELKHDPRRRRGPDGTGSQQIPEDAGRMLRRVGGDDDGRAALVPHAQGQRTEGARGQRQRLGDKVQVRQSVRLPRVARRRHQAGHGRHDRRQDRRRGRVRRRGQGMRRGVEEHGGEGPRHRDRSDQRAASCCVGIPGCHDGRGGVCRANFRHNDWWQGHSDGGAFSEDA